MKKKILIFSNHDNTTYKFRKEVITAFIKRGYLVYIALPFGENINLLEKLGCRLIDTPFDRHGTNPFAEIIQIFKYINIIKKIKPEILLTYTIKPNLYGGICSRLLHIPQIANITGLGSSTEKEGFLYYITYFLYRIAFKKIFCVFTQNKANTLFIKKCGVKNRSIKLLPGSGVNLIENKLLKYPPEEQIHFVYIGRIMREKGVNEYFRAAEYINSKYKNVFFHICGFCEEGYENIKKKMISKKIIIDHGILADINEILKICHAVVLPSYHEGMSNALLEAAAAGRPILASDIPGCQEIFDQGRTGIGFQSKSCIALIRAIEKFIQLSYDEKKEMGIRGRKKMENYFDRQIVVDAYLNEVKDAGNYRRSKF